MRISQILLIVLALGLIFLGGFGFTQLESFPSDPTLWYDYSDLDWLAIDVFFLVLGGYIICKVWPCCAVKTSTTQAEKVQKETLTQLRNSWGQGVIRYLKGQKKLDPQQVQALEEKLIAADFGAKATMSLVEHLATHTTNQEQDLAQAAKQYLTEKLKQVAQPFTTVQQGLRIMLVGVVVLKNHNCSKVRCTFSTRW